MTVDIGNILINKLVDLPWVDKYAGVVKPLTMHGDDKKRIVFPASCQETFWNCSEGKYKSLIPDSSKRSILYLEDRGIRAISTSGPKIVFRASFDLVCWLNMKLLGFEGCSYSSQAIMGILNKLPIGIPFNNGNYHKINITLNGERPKNENPFSKYSYDEATTQFLMYPFDFFVLNFDVEFEINKRCAEVSELGTVSPCLIVRPEQYAYIKDQNGEIVYSLKPGESYNVIIASGIDEGGPGTTYAIQVTDIN